MPTKKKTPEQEFYSDPTNFVEVNGVTTPRPYTPMSGSYSPASTTPEPTPTQINPQVNKAATMDEANVWIRAREKKAAIAAEAAGLQTPTKWMRQYAAMQATERLAGSKKRTIAEVQAEAEKMRQLSEQTGKVQENNLPEEGGAIEKGILAGLGKVGTTEGGAAIGGVIGGFAGTAAGGVGAIPGAAIGATIGGAIGTFIKGFTSKLQTERQENIKVEFKSLTYASNAMKQDIAYVKAGGPEADLAWNDFNRQIEIINEAERNIYFEAEKTTSGLLNVDATRELGQIRAWKNQLLPVYVNKMNFVITNPGVELDITDLIAMENFQIE